MCRNYTDNYWTNQPRSRKVKFTAPSGGGYQHKNNAGETALVKEGHEKESRNTSQYSAKEKIRLAKDKTVGDKQNVANGAIDQVMR